jgi:uncharacterized RDD family membrane protein YckC
MSEEGGPTKPPARSNGRGARSAPARLLGAGARGAERLAGATGVDKAMEDAVEEAIVRAMRSPAVERALARGLEDEKLQQTIEAAVERALASDEVAEAVVQALDSEVADRVWAELLASPKAQMLVERIAEAPEVRAAITEQGVGMVTDLGRRLTAVTERLDDALERFVHRLMRRPTTEEETTEVGFVTRLVAAGLDVGLLSAALSIGSGLLASVIPFAFGHHDRLSTFGFLGLGTLGVLIGGSLLTAFWALVGQTPGMRLLSIHLEHEGTRALGLRRALRRVLALPVAVLPAGLGVLAILVSPTRRGWHDRIAGTKVVYDQTKDEAPWSRLEPGNPQTAGTNARSHRAVDGGT